MTLRCLDSVQITSERHHTDMHKQLMRGALAAAGLGVAVTTLAVAPAQAATAIQVRPADLVLVPGTVSGTTGAAKADFLAEGIHIKTTNNTTDAARGYWKVGVPAVPGPHRRVRVVRHCDHSAAQRRRAGPLLQHRHRR